MARLYYFVAIAIVMVVMVPQHAAAISCSKVFGAKPIPVLLVADPGGMTGTGESKFLLANLQDSKNFTDFSGYCTGHITVGTLMGQKVAVITTGIGPLQASTCVQALLGCASKIKEMIYMGTSGFPATVGGILNPDNCNVSSSNTGRGQVTRIGDLCVTAFAANWDCRLEDWGSQAQGYPNLCFKPVDFAGPQVSSLYGKCLFYQAPSSSLKLAKEIAAAARSQAFTNAQPLRNSYTQTYEAAYWNATSKGTGKSWYQYPLTAPQNVFDHTQCVEVDSQFFFSGPPWEISTRDYAAQTLNLAFNTTTYTPSNVVYSNAMEGIGFTHTLEAYNSLKSTKKPMPYAIVRGNSDYTHMPVGYKGDGVWEYELELGGDFVNNYAMAIASISNAVLTTFQQRCQALKLPAATCTFGINYNKA